MITAKQIEANRRNALLSTGPKSEAGKAASRLNAIKHGIRADKLDVLPNEDPAAYQARIDDWFAHYEPTNPVEEELVRHAVDVTWKRDRAGRYESALLSVSIGDAMAKAKRARIDRLNNARRQMLPSIDEAARSGLYHLPAIQLRAEVETTADGCRWLIRAWRDLRETPLAQRAWSYQQELHVVRLLGQGPNTITNPATLDVIVANRIVHKPDAAHTPENWYDGNYQTYYDKPAIREALARRPVDRSAAMAVVVAAADREIARLENVLAQREAAPREDLGALEAEMAGVLATFDPSVEGDRLRRYQFALDRELIRTLDTLARLRRDAARQTKQQSIGANEAISPTPNEANSAAPEPAPNEAISAEVTAESGTGTLRPLSQSPLPPRGAAPNEANWELRKKRIPAHKLLAMARAAKRSQSGR